MAKGKKPDQPSAFRDQLRELYRSPAGRAEMKRRVNVRWAREKAAKAELEAQQAPSTGTKNPADE
jgi:hypothetical protein